MFYLRSLLSLVLCVILSARGGVVLAGTLSNNTLDALPDLGGITAQAGSVHPNINGRSASLTFKDSINNNKLTIAPKYSLESGFSLSGSLAYQLTNNIAIGVLPTFSSYKNELLVNTGLDLTDDQRLVVTLGQLNQKVDVPFNTSFNQEYITQNSGAFRYQLLLSDNLLRNVEINGYMSNNNGQVLSDIVSLQEVVTSTLNGLADSRLTDATHVVNLQAQLAVNPLINTTLILGLGGERLDYRQHINNKVTTQLTGHAEWNQRLINNFVLKADLNLKPMQNLYNLSLVRHYKRGHKIGLNFSTINNRTNNRFNDNKIQISYRYNLGANNSDSRGALWSSSKDRSINTNSKDFLPENVRRASWRTGLQDQVAVRPKSLP